MAIDLEVLDRNIDKQVKTINAAQAAALTIKISGDLSQACRQGRRKQVSSVEVVPQIFGATSKALPKNSRRSRRKQSRSCQLNTSGTLPSSTRRPVRS
ncbi:hypothetical protein MSSAC_1258 [Methanosarcina siciliae C2J]|uniref:Uncharacterized protein n=1 Tax=Methanosarcina siciliae C2J TaxID=1434118 RepID=A0A0E3PLZ3_9EURY|nr:hypothetical protein [Methanosarcina siciliae]AKB35848.1 hypothetical protein MSSAC_1258 [Methanosarcina siciliae C2J]